MAYSMTGASDLDLVNVAPPPRPLMQDKHVFPLSLAVTRLSGIGTDTVFIAVLTPRPLMHTGGRCQAWVAASGTVVCCDPGFASLCGMYTKEMPGRQLDSLGAERRDLEALLERAGQAEMDENGNAAGTLI